MNKELDIEDVELETTEEVEPSLSTEEVSNLNDDIEALMKEAQTIETKEESIEDLVEEPLLDYGDFKPHPLVIVMDNELHKEGLPPIARISEDGILVSDEITNLQARLAINRDLRRRLVQKELSTDESTLDARNYLYNDGLDKQWLTQVKLEVIPSLVATVNQETSVNLDGEDTTPLSE